MPFIIAVTDVNDAPTDITLDNDTVAENEPAGTIVGQLSLLGDDNYQFQDDYGLRYLTFVSKGLSGPISLIDNLVITDLDTDRVVETYDFEDPKDLDDFILSFRSEENSYTTTQSIEGMLKLVSGTDYGSLAIAELDVETPNNFSAEYLVAKQLKMDTFI